MYDDAMDDIHRRLIAHSTRDNLTYTVELVPTRAHGEGVYVFLFSLSIYSLF
jgi:hypothetical protein